MSLFSSLPPAGTHKVTNKRPDPQAHQKADVSVDDAAQDKMALVQAGGQADNSDAVVSAMAKIAAHVNTKKKFSKASKLALQLLEAGSVNSVNGGLFFTILERAMETPESSNDPALREDYKALFSAAEEHKNVFSERQQAKLEVWLLGAVLANELHTDDTFQFSGAVTKVKQALEALPEYDPGDEPTAGPPPEPERLENNTTPAELVAAPLEGSGAGPSSPDVKESLEDPREGATEPGGKRRKKEKAVNVAGFLDDPFGLEGMLPSSEGVESDPFGLNDIIPKERKRKDERAKRKREEEERAVREEAEAKELLAGRRAAVLECLKAAESQYKQKWAKTSVEILLKLAFDNIARFTPAQQAIIESLWTTVRNEQVKRKQGKAGTHKLGKQEVTSYERVASKWAGEKISIRSAVGATGDGTTVTWLG